MINAQIASIFRNREGMKKDFKTKPMVSSVSISKLDTLLMDKISKIIEKRMTDSDFTVDVLAQEVGISRSGLFAKIKAISGMTPNDYIRLIRLKRLHICWRRKKCPVVKLVSGSVSLLLLILRNVSRHSSALLRQNSDGKVVRIEGI